MIVHFLVMIDVICYILLCKLRFRKIEYVWIEFLDILPNGS